MITNIENPKESSDKLIIINLKAFSNVAGYKKMSKNQLHFWTPATNNYNVLS